MPLRVPFAVVASSLFLGSAAVAQEQQQPQSETVYYDSVDSNGRLVGGVVSLPNVPRTEAVLHAATTSVHGRAGTANRYKLVIVGDGYQTAQLPTYATHTQNFVNALFNQEPFKTYASYFVATRVDVISVDSGVDNDPTQGISRNTAMDMAFWTGGTERLLGVNVSKAQSFANSAPGGWNQVLAVANSTKYGGAGYTSNDVATLAGGNGSASEIAIHELGHSMGNLADEYDYGGPSTYTGSEPSAADVSIYTAAQQTAQSRKWFRWMGENQPAWDGLVSTYEGANYSQFGIYRPTNNSKMRALGRPFNLPSAEALIKEIYRVVNPIDGVSPETNVVLAGYETVSVTLMQPVNNPLSIQWYLNGQPIPGATQPTLNLCDLRLPSNSVPLRATVIDNTPWVRDPAIRTGFLTKSKTWTVTSTRCAADFNCDTFVDGIDADQFNNAFEAGSMTADFNGDGFVDGIDYDQFNNLFESGC